MWDERSFAQHNKKIEANQVFCMVLQLAIRAESNYLCDYSNCDHRNGLGNRQVYPAVERQV